MYLTERISPSPRVRWGLGAAATLVAIWGIVGDAAAFQRKALYEDFTSTTCPPCAALAPIQEAALEQIRDQVAVVAYHMNWPAPGNDPWCADNQVDNLNPGRRSYYSVNGVPTLLIDGTVTNARTQQAIVSAIRNRNDVNSPLRIDLRVRIAGGTLQVHVDVEAEQAVNNTRLYVALNEIYYRYDAYADWWDHYDPMVKMIPDYNGTVFSVSPGNPQSFDFEQSMAGLGWHELEVGNLILVAWVQGADHVVHQAQDFRLSVDSPSIEMTSLTVSDEAEGDGDGRLEPGEIGNVLVTMENAANFLPAESVDVTFACSDPGINVINGEFHLDGLRNGDRADNGAEPFRFGVSDDFVAHPVRFEVYLTAQPGDYTISQDTTLMIGWPPFLVVDGSNNANARDVMRALFGRDPLPWSDVWVRANEGPVIDDVLLSNYAAVIWHTGNNNVDPLVDFEADILTAYLENGGTLVMSSAYLPAVIPNHVLLTQYLALQVDVAAVRSTNYVRGYAGDPQFDGAYLFMGGGPMGFPTAKMSFTPSENAVAVMHYDDGQGADRGAAVIKHEAGTYRTLLFGFPIESVVGAARTDSLRVLTNRIWQWVQNPPQSAPNDQVVPRRFALEPAYPNPFNSQATLRFSLPTAGPARLRLFDVSGRSIATLFDARTTAGAHSALLDARELGLGSGLFYVRLEAAGRIQTSKVVFLK